MKRRGMSFVEVVVTVGLVVLVLVPVLTLGSRTVEEPRDLLERSMVQGACIDMLERYNRYKTCWLLPGEEADGEVGPEARESFGPLEADVDRATLFDEIYKQQLASMGLDAAPRVERVEDPDHPGLFRLTVSIDWTSRSGRVQAVSYSRYCFAP